MRTKTMFYNKSLEANTATNSIGPTGRSGLPLLHQSCLLGGLDGLAKLEQVSLISTGMISSDLSAMQHTSSP